MAYFLNPDEAFYSAYIKITSYYANIGQSKFILAWHW